MRAIILRQRKGTHIRTGGICSMCRLPWPILWKYTHTSIGEASLCGDCRGKALEDSFGSEDALDHSDSGGGFETNRRKH